MIVIWQFTQIGIPFPLGVASEPGITRFSYEGIEELRFNGYENDESIAYRKKIYNLIGKKITGTNE